MSKLLLISYKSKYGDSISSLIVTTGAVKGWDEFDPTTYIGSLALYRFELLNRFLNVSYNISTILTITDLTNVLG